MATNPTRRFLTAVLAPIVKRLPELLGMSFFINILSLAVPIFVLQVYDRVVFQAGITTLQGLVLGVCLAVAFDFILRQVRGRIIQRVAVRIDADVGRTLFAKLANLPLGVIESKTMPEWQVLHRDAETVRNVCAGPPVLLFLDLPFVILFIGVIWIIAAPVAWILTLIVPVFIIVSVVSQRMLSHTTDVEKEAQTERDAMVAEMIAGRAAMKSLGLGPSLAQRWEERQSRLVVSSIRRGTLTDSFNHLGMMLSLSASVAMTSVGALSIIDGELTMGALIAANMLTNKIVGPMNQLVGIWRQVIAFRGSARRLGELFAQADESGGDALDRPKPAGDLQLENVVFAYGPDSVPVVDGVTAAFPAGRMHGIIGPNGSGKTTTLKLLQRLYVPQQGRVVLDGADLEQFSRGQLAHWIGYVPQDPFLFGGTIKENIAQGREDADDEAILAAAKAAGVDDFVDDLKSGYETDVGEGGRKLSSGQRQRLAIARALFNDPVVLLLDEPSANLDKMTEERLIAVLKDLAESRTIIVVTHSPGLLKACQTITALNKGVVALAGDAADVLAQLRSPGAPPAAKNTGAGPAATEEAAE